MRELSAPQLLEVWERAAVQSPTERALTLISAAHPNLETASLARLSIGRRDGLLLSVRESTFGPRIAAITSCPECREQLEFDFAIDDIRSSDTANDSQDPLELSVEGYQVQFRLPDSNDLMIAGATSDVESARETLLQRCILSAQRKRRQTPIAELPAEVVEHVEQEMFKLDAQANVQVELECPSCTRDWSTAFDILAYFWTELDAWAQRLLFEVHKLASAYGWREADILDMSAVRRNLYLNMVRG